MAPVEIVLKQINIEKKNNVFYFKISVKIPDSEQTLRRQRTMLSQTSWRSLPLIPNLIRSFSTTKSERHSGPESSESPDVTGCAGCIFCHHRSSSYETSQTCDPSAIKAHSLNEINEDEEIRGVESKSRHDYNNIHAEFHNEVESDKEGNKEQSNDDDINIDVTI